MNNKNTVLKLKKILQEEENFLLLSHVLPDGDNIGSVIAFAEILKIQGKKATILLRDPVPGIYEFLLGSNVVFNLETIKEIPTCFIVLDCSGLDRTGEEMQFLNDRARTVINIDHHISNTGFGDIKIVKVDAAATCEVLYYLFKDMGFDINLNAAQALYTGIVTDTGGFRYESTTAHTFSAAAELLKKGVNIGNIKENVFENKELPTILILQKSLTHLSFSPTRELAWMYVTVKDMQEAEATGEHCEGLVNYPLSIKGVKMSFFFREMPDGKIKVGLRARRNYNVDNVAALFGGGGHTQAAGCTIVEPLDQAIIKVLAAAELALKGEK